MKFLKTVLAFLKRGWMRFAKALAVVNTAILLTIAYVVIIGPLSLFVRLFGKDFLGAKQTDRPSLWQDRDHVEHTLEIARRQF